MDLATPEIKKTGLNSYVVTHGNDEGLYVEFDVVPVKQEFKSEEAGRPIYQDVTMITITFPGDKTKKVHRPVDESDKMRFAKQWEVFERTGKTAQSGTPLEHWAMLGRSEAAEYKAMNIYTVEQLAALPDTALTWLGSRQQRDKAKLWLDSAKEGAQVSAIRAENENLKNDVEMLKKQIADLANIKQKEKESK